MLSLAIVPILALNFHAPQAGAPAGPQPYRVEAETESVRIARVVLAPGERVATESADGSVIVFMTADLDGRMPPAEAAWQPAGPLALENRGPARFEAVLVQFKTPTPARNAAPEPQRPYPHELAWPSFPYWPAYAYGEYPGSAFDRIQSQTIVDRPDVEVTKQKYPSMPYLEPLRVSADDTVVVYLRNGYAWPSEPQLEFQGPVRVHRGDVRLVPASVPYALTNPGGDPSEFVVVRRP